MHIINAKNVNHALSDGLWYLATAGIREESRNGAVIVAPGPVVTVYARPQERVLFNAERNANPFFHLMEALWMLAGRNDLAWPVKFNSRFAAYSDDGQSVNGAYGARWRKWFEYDQINALIMLLKRDPETRRAVLTMWSPVHDLGSKSKDIPCNTQAYFDLRGGVLNMTVCCRSNDIIWGAYGANAVHFSILQEFIATGVGVPMGVYRQISNNYHMYPEHYNIDNLRLREIEDYYQHLSIAPKSLISTDVETWMSDLQQFMGFQRCVATYEDPFFSGTAVPMYTAWIDRKNGRGSGLDIAQDIAAPDWQLACVQWIKRADERRKNNAKEG